MRSKDYPLDEGQPARLRIAFDGTAARIYFDGEEFGPFSMPELRRGWSRQLEDGSTLEVKTIRRWIFPELAILRNGRHIASSPSHPLTVLRSSSNTMMFIAGIDCLFAFQRGQLDWMALASVVLFVIGALLLRAKRRLGAAVIALPLFLELDLILLAILAGTPIDRWFLRVLGNAVLILFTIRAYRAANELRLEKLSAATSAAASESAAPASTSTP
jgi:hypothetical protein